MKKALAILFILTSFIAWASNTIKVVVLDENNEPLTGVKLIEVKEESTLFTDFDGVSELTNLDDTKVFKIEYVGYESGYIKVSPNSDSEIKVVLRKK